VYFITILNFSAVSKFRSRNSGCATFQPHTFCARLLVFDEKFAQHDVFAFVNCAVVALMIVLYFRAWAQFCVRYGRDKLVWN